MRLLCCTEPKTSIREFSRYLHVRRFTESIQASSDRQRAWQHCQRLNMLSEVSRFRSPRSPNSSGSSASSTKRLPASPPPKPTPKRTSKTPAPSSKATSNPSSPSAARGGWRSRSPSFDRVAAISHRRRSNAEDASDGVTSCKSVRATSVSEPMDDDRAQYLTVTRDRSVRGGERAASNVRDSRLVTCGPVRINACWNVSVDRSAIGRFAERLDPAFVRVLIGAVKSRHLGGVNGSRARGHQIKDFGFAPVIPPIERSADDDRRPSLKHFAKKPNASPPSTRGSSRRWRRSRSRCSTRPSPASSEVGSVPQSQRD